MTTTDTTTNIETDDLITRKQAITMAKERGFNLTMRTLNVAASNDTGPAYILRGHRAYYKAADFWAWLEARDTPPFDLRDYRTRPEIAKLFAESGVPYTVETLSIYSSWCEGPPFIIWRRRAYYHVATALAWAIERRKRYHERFKRFKPKRPAAAAATQSENPVSE